METNSKNTKVIAYLRASTDKQEIASQQIAVENWIKSEGYTDEQIIRVGKEGISACDCKGEYYRLFDEMEQYIKNENVKCVYVYCITRLVRMDESRLFRLINETLVPNGVNLKVKENGLRLLDEDGSVNGSMEMALKIMAVMAKQQTSELKAQLKRGKDYRKAKGLFAGGKPSYGYVMPDKHTAVEIDPKTAPIVERIFKMYTEEQKSTLQIGEQLFNEGLFCNCRSLASASSKVGNILKNTDYLGNSIYPMMISTITFNKAQEKLAEQYTKPRKCYDGNVYLGHGLLYFNGRPMHPRKDVRTYVHNGRRVGETESCFLNIDIADALLLQLCDEFLHAPLISDNTAILEQYNAKVAEYKRMIETKKTHIAALVENKDKITEKELLNQLSAKHADTMRSKIDEEIRLSKNTIADLECKAKDLENVIADMQKQKVIDIYALQPKEQQEIVKRCIERVFLEKVKNGTIKFAVTYKPNVAGTMDDETYMIYSHRHAVTQLRGNKEYPIILKGFEAKSHIKQADTTGMLTAEQARAKAVETLKKEKAA